MNRKFLLAGIASLIAMPLLAQKQEVKEFHYAGPFVVQSPVQMDSVDLNGSKFDAKSLLKSNLNLEQVKNGSAWSGEQLPGANSAALHLLSFDLQNRGFFKGKLNLEKAPADYQLYIDGKVSSAGDISLEPGTHTAVIKYLSQADKNDSLKVVVEAADSLKANAIEIKASGAGTDMYTVNKMMEEWRYSSASLSADGKYMIVLYYQRAPKQNNWRCKIVERATGKVVGDNMQAHWMPKSNKYYYTRQDNIDGRQIVTVDPATGISEVIAKNLPEGHFDFDPTESYLIVSTYSEGPKELNKDVFEIVHPDDRQPGWRGRSGVSKYDLKTGVLQPLTFGYNNVYVSDATLDGKYLFLQKSESHLESRPTSVMSLYRLNVETMAIDTLINRDGFFAGASVSPDGKSLLLQGSPEAFDRVGMNVKEGQTPSMYDYQYYLMDIASKNIRPVTKDFNPSVTGASVWSKFDNQIYFTANNKDSVTLYRMNPVDGKISKIDMPEDVIAGIDLAADAPVMLVRGQSAMNSDRLYSLDLKTIGTKKGAPKLVEDLSAQILDGIQVAECTPWTFKNSIGDEITCRYYTPVDMVEGKQYPMITYYYGGCSPTERNFESSYPWQCWAALGYVVLVVQPSGAAGFGQEFSARHVNTAGVDPSRDIIEAVKNFCATHSYVNPKKVGCCGASYGGFMTQYLQTVTDIFACAISHAGISDHTTYWGFGYWGYNYSEVSMANSYPWSETDLFVKNSPIYNVDKIHTPILFLHGNADVNVPYNNSVQMFNALKLLGREVAFVTVDGEDHGIAEYNKRIAWLNTSLAWFQKYLQDDDAWWEALYPKKTLY